MDEKDDHEEAIREILNTIDILGAQVTALITLVKVLALAHPNIEKVEAILGQKIQTLDAILNGLPTPDHVNSTLLALLEDVRCVVREKI